MASFVVPHPPMIVPAIGRGSEAQIEETTNAYIKIAEEVAELAPETIIITSPHATMYADYFHISPGRGAEGSFARFGAPQVAFDEEYDTELRGAICGIAEEEGFPAGTLGEVDKGLDHGTLVPLWFIRQKYNDFKIIRIGLSGLPLADHYRLGMMIRRAVEETGRRTVLIASGDLSHKLQEYGPYGFAPEGPQYDARIMDVCSRGAFGEMLEFDESFCDKAAECGHRSFVIMAGAFDGVSVRAKAYSHQDVTGVGYGVCSFYPESPDEGRHFLEEYMHNQESKILHQEEQSDDYVRLARKALESYIVRREVIDVPDGLPEEMQSTKAGAFVSIHKQGMLRGCIGTILPTENCVAEEIIRNAISASTRDPRFAPIRADELKWLEISVDVLGTPETVGSLEDLDVKRYGVIVSSGYKKGLLLPDLDGVDTVEEQVSIAMQKGGIGPDDDITLQRFEVIRHT